MNSRIPARRGGNGLVRVGAGLCVAALALGAWSLPRAETLAGRQVAKKSSLVPVTITAVPGGLTVIQEYAAEGLGLFRKFGLSVSFDYPTSGTAAAAAIASGGVQFYYSTIAEIATLRRNGVDTKAIASLENDFPGAALYCQKSVSVPVHGGYKAVFRALKNRTVGVSSIGSLTWELPAYTELASGLPLGYVKFIAVGSPATALAAYESRQIDCLVTYEPLQYEAARSHVGREVLSWANHQGPQLYQHYSFLQLSALDSYIAAHRGVVRDMARAINAASSIVANPRNAGRVAKAIARYYTGLSVGVLTTIIKDDVASTVGNALYPRDVRNAEIEAKALGELKSLVPFSDLVYPAGG